MANWGFRHNLSPTWKTSENANPFGKRGTQIHSLSGKPGTTWKMQNMLSSFYHVLENA